MSTGVLIAGLGRPCHGDDAAGLLIAQELGRRLGPPVEVVTDQTGGWEVINSLAGHSLLVIVDAALRAPGFEPGNVKRLVYPRDASAIMKRSDRDTHALSIDAVLRLGQVVDRLPPEAWIYAVAGQHFGPELDLSPAVMRGLGHVVETVESDVRRWIRQRQSEV